MSTQGKWVIGIVSIVVVFALLACGIFFGWRYFFPGKPSVVIAAPPSNYQALQGEEVMVEARATGRSIVRVELWVDDGLMDSASSPSPQDAFSAALTWQASGVGPHTVEVRAYDARGQASEPAAIVLIVTTGVAEATPTVTVGPPFETPTPTTPPPPPTETPTSPPEATATPTSPPPTATPTLAPPVIDSFTIDDSTITAGETTWLRWEFHNATESHLYRDDVEIQSDLPSSGNRAVNPAVTRTFKLVVSNAVGSAEASLTLTVNPAGPPVIEFFTASPDTINAGDSSTLEWGSVTNATSVEIDQGIGGVPTPDSTVVSPATTTTYTMTAVGAGGTTTASVTVTVEHTVTLDTVPGETGQVVQTGGSAASLYVGDTSANVGSRGFMSFDISGLAGKTVTEAKLNFPGPDIDGDPFGDLSGLWIGKTSYTWPPPYAPPATAMSGTQYSMPAQIIITSYVAPEVSGGAPRFQVTLHFNANTNGDHGTDRIWWPPGGHPTLTITYTD